MSIPFYANHDFLVVRQNSDRSRIDPDGVVRRRATLKISFAQIGLIQV
jgi:hypothetical protein